MMENLHDRFERLHNDLLKVDILIKLTGQRCGGTSLNYLYTVNHSNYYR